MGAAKSKVAREAPVRYVAMQAPQFNKVPIEKQMKKPEFTAYGINTRKDDVNTEPIMYVETAKDGEGTELTDHAAPRWYLNTYMEMMDNARTDQVIISGNLPSSWERDKFEPYSLVKGRIDDEDLRWVLSPENKAKPVEELVRHTKLERGVLQDILDTVEMPRVQYRNYKGKLHKTLDDANTYMTARKQQLERAREQEVLRRIGYSDEEMEKEDQYLTTRSRGVKTLDDLGASIRERKRSERSGAANEMETLLEERRIQQLESGEGLDISEEELIARPAVLTRDKVMRSRTSAYKNLYAADQGKDDRNFAKFHWWMDRTRRIKRAVDTIHGVPVYNERLSANEEKTRRQMREAAEFNYALSRAQGAKGFSDPRANYEQILDVMRANKSEDRGSVNIQEDGVDKHAIFSFPKDNGQVVDENQGETRSTNSSSVDNRKNERD